MFPVYLDYNATTPVDEEVIEEVSRSMKAHWGNPSSFHVLGQQAKDAIEQSRVAVARMLNANSEDIIFTSGGTEANNFALSSLIKSARASEPERTPHVITSNVEHDSIANVLKEQEKSGAIELTIVAVDETGQLCTEKVISSVKANTCAITIMHANNETGIIMPIQEISNALEKVNQRRLSEGKSHIFFHCDAAQTTGKVQVDVKSLGVDMLTIVGHKFYATRIGALYCRDLLSNAARLQPIFQGGGQERGFRPGTENTPMIVGLGKAAELVHRNLQKYHETMKCLSASLSLNLQDSIPGLRINFENVSPRLPNTVSVCLPEGLLASVILKEKCKNKLLASVGAACHSNVDQPSAILLASGLSPSESKRTIRLSVGRTTTKDEILSAVKALKEACTI